MIQPEEKPESDVPELTAEDMYALLYILLKMAGGTVRVSHKVFEEKPEKLMIKRVYDKVNKVWFFKVPVPRKRGKIAQPRKKLIIPN